MFNHNYIRFISVCWLALMIIFLVLVCFEILVVFVQCAFPGFLCFCLTFPLSSFHVQQFYSCLHLPCSFIGDQSSYVQGYHQCFARQIEGWTGYKKHLFVLIFTPSDNNLLLDSALSLIMGSLASLPIAEALALFSYPFSS